MKRIIFAVSLPLVLTLNALPACAQNAGSPVSEPSVAATDGIPRFTVDRYVVEGNTLLAPETIDALLTPYRGPARTFANVQQALEALEAAYRAAGYSTVQVILPEQELDAGKVTLRVIEGRIGQVLIEGNRFYDDANIRTSLPTLREGDLPDLEALGASLRVANENPSKQTQLVMRAAEEEGKIDAAISVRDESPIKAFVTHDNTGTSETGISRIGLGWQHNNLFNSDHSLTLRYTTSDKPSKVSIYGLGYHIPLYHWGHSIDIFAGRSDVTSGVIANLFNVSGKGDVYGARYNQHLPRIGALEHKIAYGIDYRVYKNSTIPLGGGASITPDYTVHPLSITYDARLTGESHETTFYAGLVAHPGGSGKAGSDTFRSVRYSAQDTYRILRAGAQHTQRLPADWQFRATFAAQRTPHALVPGEQFGVGGNASVRGFNERELANDSGISASLELYTPDVGSSITEGATLRGLVFADKGYLSRNHALPGEYAHQGIASIGAGIRLGFGRNFSLKFDAAHVVEEKNYERSAPNPKLHFGLGYIF